MGAYGNRHFFPTLSFAMSTLWCAGEEINDLEEILHDSMQMQAVGLLKPPLELFALGIDIDGYHVHHQTDGKVVSSFHHETETLCIKASCCFETSCLC